MTGSDSIKTIADIARVAGVSKATVSRALNDSPLVNVDTRERIRAIASEHGFEMNDSARRLSTRESNVVALVTYSYESSEKLADAFMLEIVSGLNSALHDDGYDLLLIQIAPRDLSWIRRYLDSGRVDGFVLLAATCTTKQLETISERGAPAVIWGLRSLSRAYSTVCGDGVAGGRIATEHLLTTGRRKVAFIGGNRDSEGQDRYAGYAAALSAAGIEVDDTLVNYAAHYSAATSAAIIREMLADHGDIDGVFACSDTLAMAVIEELRGHGRNVPGDVAVVGYDDIAVAATHDPPLTTVRQSGLLAGRLLAQSIAQRLRTGAVTHVSMPAELIVRGSA